MHKDRARHEALVTALMFLIAGAGCAVNNDFNTAGSGGSGGSSATGGSPATGESSATGGAGATGGRGGSGGTSATGGSTGSGGSTGTGGVNTGGSSATGGTGGRGGAAGAGGRGGSGGGGAGSGTGGTGPGGTTGSGGGGPGNCLDDMQNGDETGVDCGGSCPACPSYKINPPNLKNMASSGCQGGSGFMCARSMVFSPEFKQAEADDFGSPDNPAFVYGTVGHDPDTGGLDANSNTCCECYQLVFTSPRDPVSACPRRSR